MSNKLSKSVHYELSLKIKTQREGFEPPYACAHRLSRPAPYRARRPLQKIVQKSD